MKSLLHLNNSQALLLFEIEHRNQLKPSSKTFHLEKVMLNKTIHKTQGTPRMVSSSKIICKFSQRGKSEIWESYRLSGSVLKE